MKSIVIDTPSLLKQDMIWFDTYMWEFYPIDKSCTDSDGNPVTPLDCVPVRPGTKIKIYRNLETLTSHICIGGRAIEEDRHQGLFSESDFANSNYELIKTFEAKL